MFVNDLLKHSVTEIIGGIVTYGRIARQLAQRRKIHQDLSHLSRNPLFSSFHCNPSLEFNLFGKKHGFENKNGFFPLLTNFQIFSHPNGKLLAKGIARMRENSCDSPFPTFPVLLIRNILCVGIEVKAATAGT